MSWAVFQGSDDARLRELASAVDQFADLLAGLMTVDGAVVLTKQLTVVGFGVEVYAPQLHLPVVYRALDAEATRLQPEADGGGTRHRAAYRLCLAEPESMVVVISQDGGGRLVHAQAGKVVFWEQLTVWRPGNYPPAFGVKSGALHISPAP